MLMQSTTPPEAIVKKISNFTSYSTKIYKRLLRVFLLCFMIFTIASQMVLTVQAVNISGAQLTGATWNNNDIISGAVTIGGGTSTVPILINITGTVTVNSTITVATGAFVRFQGGGTLLRGTSKVAIITITGTGNITLQDITINGNNAGSVTAAAISGSGNSPITLLGTSSVRNNINTTANGNGGGIYTMSGSVTLRDTATITGNSAANGGGIYIYNGILNMYNNATVNGNNANFGGGVYCGENGIVMNDDSKISGNTATQNNTAYSGGGGVYSFFAPITMKNRAEISNNYVYSTATIPGNSGGGGGVYFNAADAGEFLTMNDDSKMIGNKVIFTAPSDAGANYRVGGGAVYIGEDASGGGVQRCVMTGNALISQNEVIITYIDGEIPTNINSGGGGIFSGVRGNGLSVAGNARIILNTCNISGDDIYARNGITAFPVNFMNITFSGKTYQLYTDNNAPNRATKGNSTARVTAGLPGSGTSGTGVGNGYKYVEIPTSIPVTVKPKSDMVGYAGGVAQNGDNFPFIEVIANDSNGAFDFSNYTVNDGIQTLATFIENQYAFFKITGGITASTASSSSEANNVYAIKPLITSTYVWVHDGAGNHFFLQINFEDQGSNPAKMTIRPTTSQSVYASSVKNANPPNASSFPIAVYSANATFVNESGMIVDMTAADIRVITSDPLAVQNPTQMQSLTASITSLLPLNYSYIINRIGVVNYSNGNEMVNVKPGETLRLIIPYPSGKTAANEYRILHFSDGGDWTNPYGYSLTPTIYSSILNSDNPLYIAKTSLGLEITISGFSPFAILSNTLHNITASAGNGGSISTPGLTTVTEGDNLTYDITPDSHYRIKEILVDGSPVAIANSYTFNNISANHTIAVSFELIEYTVTASAGSGGSISIPGPTTVTEGDNLTYDITPDSHYRILEILVDGSPVAIANSYTFTNISANHTIAVSFEFVAEPPTGDTSSADFISLFAILMLAVSSFVVSFVAIRIGKL